MPYKDREKQNTYQKQRNQRRKLEWFATNGPCVQCGSTENLQLDHVDRTIKVSHRVWSWSDKRQAEELAKCQVLCKGCHVAKTYIDMQYQKNHGTLTLYNEGCRCDDCLERKKRANALRYIKPTP